MKRNISKRANNIEDIKNNNNIINNTVIIKPKINRVKSSRGIPMNHQILTKKTQTSQLSINIPQLINDIKSKDNSNTLKVNYQKSKHLNISTSQSIKNDKTHELNKSKPNIKKTKSSIRNMDIIKKNQSVDTDITSTKTFSNPTNINISNISQTNSNIKVFIRFRPLNELESALLNSNSGWCVPEYINESTIGIYTNKESLSQKLPLEKKNIFKFDKIFNSESNQSDLYNNVGKRIAKDILEGYNGTIFAYGQSGSGKTHTMYGPDIFDMGQKGIIPRIAEEIFGLVEKSDNNIDFQFKLSVLEIYKEILFDLLTQEKDLKIQENPNSGVFVDGLSEVYLSSLNEFFDYVNLSQSNRKVTETKLNHNSSRSHCILILEITQSFKNENIIKKGILNLVDLAGSEKVSKTGAVGETLEEAKKINLSLSTLGNVIHALTHKSDHIPYRDSKLTRLLKESLGGNYKTSLIVTCSPHSYNLDEILSSLLFAKRVKTIKNNFKPNIKYSYEELQKMVNLLNEKLIIANTKLKNKYFFAKRSNNLCEESKNKDNKINNNVSNKESSNNEILSSFFECSNCILLKKDKKLLEEKIQKLLDDIQEKDNEINRLKNTIEINNNHCSRYINDSAKKSFAIASSGDNNLIISIKDFSSNENNKNNKNQNQNFINIIDSNMNNINTNNNSILFKDEKKQEQIFDLYEKIKEILKKIEEENTRINIIQNEEDELRKIQFKIDKFQNIINDFLQTKDKISCFTKMDNFTKISIPFVKKKDYQKEFEFYKDNLINVFENTFSKRNNNNCSDKDYLNLLSTDLFFEYLRFYFCQQIMSQGYQKLILDNNSLQKMNGYLFDIVQNILSSNLDMANDNILNANALNILRNSLILDSFISQGFDTKNNFNISQLNNNNQKILNVPNINQKKFIKVISKKSLELKNSFVSPNINNTNRTNTNSFVLNNTNSIHNNEDQNQNDRNTLKNNSILSLNKAKSQEIDKSLSKLQMLRNVLVNNITKSEEIQQKIKDLKEYLNNVIYLNMNFFHKEILNKAKPTYMLSNLTQEKDDMSKELFNYNSEEEIIPMKDLNSINRKTNFYTESGSELNNNIFIQNYCDKTRQMSTLATKLNSHSNKKSMKVLSNNSSTLAQANSMNLLTVKKDIKNNNCIVGRSVNSQSLQSFTHSKSNANIAHMKKNNSKFDLLNIQEKKGEDIKDAIEKYLETGTATRKFDGVLVNYENGEVKCEIAGGLAAEHKIDCCPLQDQLCQVKGDDDNSFFLSIGPNNSHYNSEIMINNSK